MESSRLCKPCRGKACGRIACSRAGRIFRAAGGIVYDVLLTLPVLVHQLFMQLAAVLRAVIGHRLILRAVFRPRISVLGRRRLLGGLLPGHSLTVRLVFGFPCKPGISLSFGLSGIIIGAGGRRGLGIIAGAPCSSVCLGTAPGLSCGTLLCLTVGGLFTLLGFLRQLLLTLLTGGIVSVLFLQLFFQVVVNLFFRFLVGLVFCLFRLFVQFGNPFPFLFRAFPVAVEVMLDDIELPEVVNQAGTQALIVLIIGVARDDLFIAGLHGLIGVVKPVAERIRCSGNPFSIPVRDVHLEHGGAHTDTKLVQLVMDGLCGLRQLFQGAVAIFRHIDVTTFTYKLWCRLHRDFHS